MDFNQDDVLVIKNIDDIWDVEWYDKDSADYADLKLTVGENVKIAFNKYNTYRPYHLVKDNLESQDFTQKEMELLFL